MPQIELELFMKIIFLLTVGLFSLPSFAGPVLKFDEAKVKNLLKPAMTALLKDNTQVKINSIEYQYTLKNDGFESYLVDFEVFTPCNGKKYPFMWDMDFYQNGMIRGMTVASYNDSIDTDSFFKSKSFSASDLMVIGAYPAQNGKIKKVTLENSCQQ